MRLVIWVIFLCIFGTPFTSGQTKRKKIGLVLSGGGAKGFAHIGVLRAIENSGIPIDYIGGTSMGALVGGLYAMGISIDEIEYVISITDWGSVLGDQVAREDMRFDDKISKDENFASVKFKNFEFQPLESYSRGQQIRNILHYFALRYPQKIDFSKLPIPFYCIATNIENGDTEVLESGDLAESLRASMSIPSIFQPVLLDNKLMVDGGLVNNFPADIMATKGMDYIIGIDVQTYLQPKENITTFVDVIDQALSFTNNLKVNNNIGEIDLHIKPDISKYHMLSFEDVDSILQLGYDVGKAYEPTFALLNKTIFEDNQYSPISTLAKRNKIQDSIYIHDIQFRGLEKLTEKVLLKNFKNNKSNKFTYHDIYAIIRRITSQNNLAKMKYNIIEKDDNKNSLLIEIEEDIPGKVGVGLHYNTYFGANILFSGQYDNLILKNSRIKLKLNIAQEFSYKASYKINLSDRLRWGISTLSHHSRINQTIDPYDVEPVKGNSTVLRDGRIESFLRWENHKVNTHLGIQIQDYRINANADLKTPQQDFLYYVPRFIIEYDNLNNIDYPTFGDRLFLQSRITLNSNSSIHGRNAFNILAKYKKAIPVNPKLTLIPNIQAGFTFDINAIGKGVENDTLQGFFIGGYKETLKPEYIDFIGLNYFSFRDIREFAIARMDAQYELKNDLFLTLRLNRMTTNFTIIDDRSEKLNLWGYGVSLGMNTFIGPIEFAILGNERELFNIYASIGLSLRNL